MKLPRNTNSAAGSDCPGETYSPIVVATVEWIRGNRLMSDLMANAGLGLSGVGEKERVEITYKPGEKVDEARVLKAVNHMIHEADETNAAFKFSCPRVVSISEANAGGGAPRRQRMIATYPAHEKPHRADRRRRR
jgi:hypothetical protein